MTRWKDLPSGRDVVVLDAETTRDWPGAPAWRSAKFCLLLLAEHVVDPGPLLARALPQGLVFASAWGPGCELVEESFDEEIAGDGERPEEPGSAILTTSHPDESLEEALEFFLEAVCPAPEHVHGCDTWVVYPVGAACRARVETALRRRAARPVA